MALLIRTMQVIDSVLVRVVSVNAYIQGVYTMLIRTTSTSVNANMHGIDWYVHDRADSVYSITA